MAKLIQLIHDEKFEFNLETFDTKESIPEISSDETLALLDLYAYEAQQANHFQVKDRVDSFIKPRLKDSTISLTKAWHDRIADENLKPIVSIPGDYGILIIDFSFRLLFLGIFLFILSESNDIVLLMMVNFLAIPLITISILSYRNKTHSSKNISLLTDLNLKGKIQLQQSKSATYYVFASLIFLTGFAVSYGLGKHYDKAALIYFGSIGYFIYLLLIVLTSKGRLTQKQIHNNLAEHIDLSGAIDSDENDEVIVLIKTKLKTITAKLESYVIESALLGALAFSGFLQIMAEGMATTDYLSEF